MKYFSIEVLQSFFKFRNCSAEFSNINITTPSIAVIVEVRIES